MDGVLVGDAGCEFLYRRLQLFLVQTSLLHHERDNLQRSSFRIRPRFGNVAKIFLEMVCNAQAFDDGVFSIFPALRHGALSSVYHIRKPSYSGDGGPKAFATNVLGLQGEGNRALGMCVCSSFSNVPEAEVIIFQELQHCAFLPSPVFVLHDLYEFFQICCSLFHVLVSDETSEMGLGVNEADEYLFSQRRINPQGSE